jgi:hypothetical protein
MEEWRDIKGYEGLYQVSNLGRVKSLSRTIERSKYGSIFVSEKILSTNSTKGYLYVSLCKCGKQKRVRVHRLVAEAFIPNQDNLPEVNHKDENKENNAVSNLEWCTNKYNCNYGTGRERNPNCQKGRKVSDATREKLRLAGLNRHHSESTKLKMSLSHRKRNNKYAQTDEIL